MSNGPYIRIPSCYVKDSSLCKRELIPTADVDSKWAHLSYLNMLEYYKDAPIGILIGYRCPQVM